MKWISQLFLALFLVVCAQPNASAQPKILRYSAFHSSSLSSASTAVTVQQPASGGRRFIFRTGWVYCSVACTVTLRVDGTAASGTALTMVGSDLDVLPVSKALAFYDSNVGSGMTVLTFDIAAGADKNIDLTGYEMNVSSTAVNLTLSTNSITGTVKILITGDETTN